MSAVMLLLLSQSSRNAAASSAHRSSGIVSGTPAIVTAGDSGPDLNISAFPDRTKMFSDSIPSNVDKELRQLAVKLMKGVAEDKGTVSALGLGAALTASAEEAGKRLGVQVGDIERRLVKHSIGQLLNPNRHFEAPESFFTAVDALWSRADALQLPLHKNWEGQMRHRLDKQLDTAIYNGKDAMGDYTRARAFLNDGSDLFTRLEDRTWWTNPLILAGTAISRRIGGSPAFSVADVLCAKNGA